MRYPPVGITQMSRVKVLNKNMKIVLDVLHVYISKKKGKKEIEVIQPKLCTEAYSQCPSRHMKSNGFIYICI